MRNIKEQRKQAKEIIKKHPGLDLAAKEVLAFRDSFIENTINHGMGNSIYDLAMDAYYMGLAVGYRNGKKEASKKTKVSKKTVV